jgi:hypothetical protein
LKENGPHSRLAKLAGDWTDITKTWFEPDVIGDVSQMEGKITPVLYGHFVLHEYTGSMNNKPFRGVAIYDFDLNTNKFQSAWFEK